jgi:hypothetical protein
MEMAHSLIDEVNLAEKIHRWIDDEPDNHFFYRPSANSCVNQVVVENENSDVQLHGSVSGFLLIHQTHWQQKLLVCIYLKFTALYQPSPSNVVTYD